MDKKIYLISGIITSIVFISMLIEVVGYYYNSSTSQIKIKEIIYMMGWLISSFVLLYHYFIRK